MPGRLTIRRIRADYLVERETADPSRVRDACDSALRQHLARDLASALGRWFDRDDPSVWVVRSLALELGVGADWKSDRLAGAFTARIAHELAGALTGEGDGANAIRFPDRAAYLARFLADAATGDAWSRWYYATFDGLRTLPTSSALRTALLEDPRLGLDALRRLGDLELARVVGALSARDRERVLERFAASTAADEAADAAARAWSAWEEHPGVRAEADARVLALFVRAAHAGRAGPALRAAVEALCVAQDRAARLDAAGLRDVLAWLTSAAPLDAARVESGPGARSRLDGALTALRAAPPELIARVFAARDGARAGANDTSGAASTPFGGVFFFLPQLDTVPLEEWLASWPAPEGAPTAAALRLLVAAKCMGTERAEAAFADPVLRRLLRIEPGFTPASARAWLRKAGPERRRALRRAVKDAADAGAIDLRMCGEDRARLALPRDIGIARAWDDVLGAIAWLVLRTFARRLPGFSGSRFAHLHRNFLDVGATLEEEAERLVVRVARPPLYLVLNLTGMTRTSYRIRGEARPIAVFAQE